MIRSDTVRALCDFVSEQGARIEFKPTGSGHDKAIISLGDRSRFITISRSPRGPNRKKVLGDARRVLRALSETRPHRARELSRFAAEQQRRAQRDDERMQRWYSAKGAGLLDR
jgi:hypothetical protein